MMESIFKSLRAFGAVVRPCCLDPDCPGECKETNEGVIYCPECGREDFSNME